MPAALRRLWAKATIPNSVCTFFKGEWKYGLFSIIIWGSNLRIAHKNRPFYGCGGVVTPILQKWTVFLYAFLDSEWLMGMETATPAGTARGEDGATG